MNLHVGKLVDTPVNQFANYMKDVDVLAKRDKCWYLRLCVGCTISNNTYSRP
jgi:hypothetical protein